MSTTAGRSRASSARNSAQASCRRSRAAIVVQLPGHVEAEGEPEDLPAAQAAEHSVGRVAVEDAEVLLEDLPQGPVGDPAAVGEAAARAPERLLGEPGQPLPQLAHERRVLPTPASPRIVTKWGSPLFTTRR